MATNSPMIFINLPVVDLPAATAFYKSLGFTVNPKFSNALATQVSIGPANASAGSGGSSTINVMLLTRDFFMGFLPKGRGQICDAKKATEVLLCISADSRTEVDAWADKAKWAGAEIDVVTMPQMEGMYGRSFADLDGHVWEVMWMSLEAVDKMKGGSNVDCS